ncbi:MAG: acyl-CoA/acyl-ACP dehydrogenase [Planctomycetes bacterium]|nr:acyl-CoA/acyl-ACP dehydrogenase [Planctomycetota bacterium]
MQDLLQKLQIAAGPTDDQSAWPAAQFGLLAEAGVLRWVIPTEYGGLAYSERDLLQGYIELSSACLTTTFVLTQRNGACQRLANSTNTELKAELLPALAQGQLFATVGISHLTTSRQHWRQPAVQVTETDSGWCFDGEIPWVTGAEYADYLVTGGTLSDGRQVLAAIPRREAGVTVAPAARLLSLSASATSPVRLDNVILDRKFLVAGPVEQVMRLGAGSTGALATSALATGLARAALDHLQTEAAQRGDLLPIYQPLQQEWTTLRDDLLLATDRERVAGNLGLSTEAIRGRANSLVLRATQALLAASKGAGFVCGHFAERAVREALFFLVWSCPQPVVAAALRELAGLATC